MPTETISELKLFVHCKKYSLYVCNVYPHCMKTHLNRLNRHYNFFVIFEFWLNIKNEMSQLMRLWYLSYRQPAKTQMSLHICAVWPEPSLFAHMKYGSIQRVQQKIRHLADEKCNNLTRWLISPRQKHPAKPIWNFWETISFPLYASYPNMWTPTRCQ